MGESVLRIKLTQFNGMFDPSVGIRGQPQVSAGDSW
jgi:hypothetical protein